jgi:hypothetical protein
MHHYASKTLFHTQASYLCQYLIFHRRLNMVKEGVNLPIDKLFHDRFSESKVSQFVERKPPLFLSLCAMVHCDTLGASEIQQWASPPLCLFAIIQALAGFFVVE